MVFSEALSPFAGWYTDACACAGNLYDFYGPHVYFAFQLICSQNRQQEQLNLFFFWIKEQIESSPKKTFNHYNYYTSE
jgi:hypothetical protein